MAGKTDNNLTVDIWYSSIYEIALDSQLFDLADFAVMSDVFDDEDSKVFFHPRTEVRSCFYCDEESKE